MECAPPFLCHRATFLQFSSSALSEEKLIERHNAFFQLRLEAKQLQTSFSYSSAPCHQRQRSLCSVSLWDAADIRMLLCYLESYPWMWICFLEMLRRCLLPTWGNPFLTRSQSLSGPLKAYSPHQSAGSKKQQFSEILTGKELIAVFLPPCTAIFCYISLLFWMLT